MSVLFVASSTQYFTLPNNMAFTQNIAGFTAFCIIRPSSIPSSGNEVRVFAISNNTGVGTSRVTITHRNDGSGGFMRAFSRRLDGDGGETADTNPAATGAINANTTYSIAIVCDWAGGFLGAYIDGRLEASVSPGSWTGNSSNTVSLFSAIGARGDGGQPFDGLIENMMWWPAALPLHAIRALHVNNGALSNARTLAGNVDAYFWPMRGTLPAPPSIIVEIWKRGGFDGSQVNSPTYNVHLGVEPAPIHAQ